MNLLIDGKEIYAQPGSSILDMLRKLGMDSDLLSQKPLAAKIAGEVFNLNYIPVRNPRPDRPSIRTAMAASGGKVQLLRYHDPVGKDVYVRTAQFVLFLAIRQLWPQAKAKAGCTVGPSLFVEVSDCEFSWQALKSRVQELVKADIPLLRQRITTAEAMQMYLKDGQIDKAKLLSWRESEYFDVYTYEDYAEYYYGELAPSTGCLKVWEILPHPEGFLFLYPDDLQSDRVATYRPMPNFQRVSQQGKQWCRLMECQTVADLNELVRSGKIRQLVRVNEALHEKQFAQVADAVCTAGAQAVFLAGPSSSGKTTSANRLATQLRVHGKKPVLMSLDDYYIDRDKIAPGPDGKLDLEHINTIDTELFRTHLVSLLDGKTVELPHFDFKSGRRQWIGNTLCLTDDTVIIVEGLHALNPALIPEGLERKRIFKLYVSPLLPLNLDDHNRIPTSYLRLLRRTVRDYATRGSSVQNTMSMWDSVRRGEKLWIYPYQEQADWILNSSTLYELAVLKKYIYPLLTAITADEDCYEQVRGIVKILNYVLEADVEDEIPPTSLVREFIGGNSFYK